jgi:outer membrane receptor for ferrienterochelin and colicins
MRIRQAVASLALALALLASAPGARADGPSDLEAALAEPVVSTASQSAEDQSTAPATVTTITAEELRRYGMTTLAEAINFLSLGMITQNNLDDVEIGARGVLLTGDYGDHVLLLVNGHAMNEQWDGTAYFGRGAGIPFELIDHIEVVLGPGSVLYGSQAMLGVINIVTKQAKDFDGFHFIAESSLLTSERGAIGFGKEFTLFGKRGELTYEIEYYNQNGPSFFFGPQNVDVDPSTGKGKCFNATCSAPGIWGGAPATNSYWAKEPDGYLRLIWGDFELDLHAESYQRATPYEAYTSYNDPNQYEIDRFLRADLRHRWAISSTAQLRSRLYGDLYDYREQLPTVAAGDCNPGQTMGCIYEGTGYSRWMGIEEQLSFDWLHDQSLTTLLGFDGRVTGVGEANYEYNLNTFTTPPPGGVFDANQYRLAGYGQQTWRPLRWLFLNVGARVDDEEHLANAQLGTPSVAFTRVSPRASVAVNPWKGGTLKVIYAEAFRAPTFFESSFTDNQTVIPNYSLQPEVVRSGEVSFEQRVGTQRFFVGGFDAQYSDLVESNLASPAALDSAVKDGILPPPMHGSTILGTYGPNGYGTSQYQNLSTVSDLGINAAFEGTALHKDLRYGLNVTGAYARQDIPNPLTPSATCPPGTAIGTTSMTNKMTIADSCNTPIPVTPAIFGNARISYDLPGDWPIIGLVASLVGPRPADGAFDSNWKTAPYAPTQLDLRATISGAVPGIPRLTYRFIADYAAAAVNPYVVGEATTYTRANPLPELVPVDQFRTTLGLQYDLR